MNSARFHMSNGCNYTIFFTKTVFMLLRGDECFSDMQKDGSNIKDLKWF